MLDLIASSAPYAAIQMFFAVLVIFFFLAGWTRMRKRTITTRARFDGALTTARVIQQVVDAQPTYLGTIPLDRKSVASGTSVSVSVDLGGLRFIIKKTHTPLTSL